MFITIKENHKKIDLQTFNQLVRLIMGCIARQGKKSRKEG